MFALIRIEYIESKVLSRVVAKTVVTSCNVCISISKMLEMSCLFKYLSGKRTEDFTFLNFPSVCGWERNNFHLSVQLFLSKNISFVAFGCVSQGLLVGPLGSVCNRFIILFPYEGRIFPILINWLDRNQRRITEFACICQFENTVLEFWQANYLATVPISFAKLPFDRQNAQYVWLGQSSEFLVIYAIQKSFTLNSSLAYQLRQWFIGQFHSVHYCRELNRVVLKMSYWWTVNWMNTAVSYLTFLWNKQCTSGL